MALEIAMDEMAEKLRMDPVEFRVLNDTQVDPEHPDRPFSKRQLVPCLQDRRGEVRLERAQSRSQGGHGMGAGSWATGWRSPSAITCS